LKQAKLIKKLNRKQKRSVAFPILHLSFVDVEKPLPPPPTKKLTLVGLYKGSLNMAILRNLSDPFLKSCSRDFASSPGLVLTLAPRREIIGAHHHLEAENRGKLWPGF